MLNLHFCKLLICEEDRRLWTKAVPEIAVSLGLKPGQLMRVLGTIYGLTNAPRIFWQDVDFEFQSSVGFLIPWIDAFGFFVIPKGRFLPELVVK